MHSNACVVRAARGWIGTRFHHQGRLKKTATHRGGVDCLGLLAGVADELQLRSADDRLLSGFDETDYSHYPDTQRLKAALGRFLRQIPSAEIAPGDVVLLQIDHMPQHLAIVSNQEDGLGLIHAYAPARAVVEHYLDAWWQSNIVCAYRIPNITH